MLTHNQHTLVVDCMPGLLPFRVLERVDVVVLVPVLPGVGRKSCKLRANAALNTHTHTITVCTC